MSQSDDRDYYTVPKESIFASHDVQRMQAALKISAGALAGVDREALLRDLRAARQQDSAGRPA